MLIQVEAAEVTGGLELELVLAEMAFYARCKQLVQTILHITGEAVVRVVKDIAVILRWRGDWAVEAVEVLHRVFQGLILYPVH